MAYFDGVMAQVQARRDELIGEMAALQQAREREIKVQQQHLHRVSRCIEWCQGEVAEIVAERKVVAVVATRKVLKQALAAAGWVNCVLPHMCVTMAMIAKCTLRCLMVMLLRLAPFTPSAASSVEGTPNHHPPQPHSLISALSVNQEQVIPNFVSLVVWLWTCKATLWLLTPNHCVQVLSAAGKLIHKFGCEGIGDGQFRFPCAVAVDMGGNIVVADTCNDCVQVFSAAGKFIHEFGSMGSGDGQFDWPRGVAVDMRGNIVVADIRNHRVQVLSAVGKFICQFGCEGSGAGQFMSPYGVAVDKAGNIVVADRGNNRVLGVVRQWPAEVPVWV